MSRIIHRVCLRWHRQNVKCGVRKCNAKTGTRCDAEKNVRWVCADVRVAEARPWFEECRVKCHCGMNPICEEFQEFRWALSACHLRRLNSSDRGTSAGTCSVSNHNMHKFKFLISAVRLKIKLVRKLIRRRRERNSAMHNNALGLCAVDLHARMN